MYLEALGELWGTIGSSLGHLWVCSWVLKRFGGGVLGHMRVTVGHFRGTDDTFGATLMSLWDHFRIILGLLRVTLESL